MTSHPFITCLAINRPSEYDHFSSPPPIQSPTRHVLYVIGQEIRPADKIQLEIPKQILYKWIQWLTGKIGCQLPSENMRSMPGKPPQDHRVKTLHGKSSLIIQQLIQNTRIRFFDLRLAFDLDQKR